MQDFKASTIEPSLAMVVAVSQNGVIGRDNDLPWRLRDDLVFFKKTTMGGALILGRKNFESIGRALPGRQNIVLTRGPAPEVEGVQFVASLEQALAAATSRPIFIIGGGMIYELALPQTQVIYRTVVQAEVEGDVFFPRLNESEWEKELLFSHLADERNEYAFTVEKLTRK